MQFLVLKLAVVVAGLAYQALAENVTALGLNPVKDYCVRISHQSTVKNGMLYIDGGIQTFARVNQGGNPGNSSITTGYNNYLIQVNMSSSWDWSSNISQVLLTKTPNPATGTSPPVVVRGALYSGGPSDDNIYLYGGTTSYINTSFLGFVPSTSNQYTLWSFDTKAKQWNQWDVTDTSPYRPNAGAWTDAPDQGLAFYFNGQIDNGSSITTQSLPGNTQSFLEGMVVLNTTSRTARNLSTTAISGDNPRTRGTLSYLPGIGDNGILVYLGGSYKSVNDVNNEEIGTLVPMDTIDIFDIASSTDSADSNGTWYKQKTSGSIPAGRVDHCVVAASAPDNSSHNIYVYGGRGSETHVYDQIYVLSLPSFTWTNVYEGDSPRFGMTCHTVANRQMITIGGFSTPNISSWCDWESKGVAILDISAMKWGSVYNATAGLYTVPNTVVSSIGGSINGGATFTKPKDDWTNAALAKLFNSTLSSNSTSSTPTPTPVPTNTLTGGAIAGIVVGCVIGLGLLFGIIWFLIRRRERGPKPKTEPSQVFETDGEQFYEKDGVEPASDGYRPPLPKKDTPFELPSPDNPQADPTKSRRLAELGTEDPALELP